MLKKHGDDIEAAGLAYLAKEVRHNGERFRNRWQFQIAVAARYGLNPYIVEWWWRQTPSPAAVIERAERVAAGPRLPGL